jgi:hypothetical protein
MRIIAIMGGQPYCRAEPGDWHIAPYRWRALDLDVRFSGGPESPGAKDSDVFIKPLFTRLWR